MIADSGPASSRGEILYYYLLVFGECHRFVMDIRCKLVKMVKRCIDVLKSFLTLFLVALKPIVISCLVVKYSSSNAAGLWFADE